MSSRAAKLRGTSVENKPIQKAKYSLSTANAISKRRQRPQQVPQPLPSPIQSKGNVSRGADKGSRGADNGNRGEQGSRAPTRASTRVPTRLEVRTATRLDKIETATMYTEGSIVTRNLYLGPAGYEPPHVKKFKAYLKETQIEEIFKELLTILLDRPALPYNPYPGFVRRFRKYSERHHIRQLTDDRILQNLFSRVTETSMPYLYTLSEQQHVWGLSGILRAVRPEKLIRYKWMMDSLSPDKISLPSFENYTIQATIALVGPCIFEGTFYEHCYSIQLRKEFLIVGGEMEKGVDLYVKTLMKEINAMYRAKFESSTHHILGVNIPKATIELQGSPEFAFWDKNKIDANKEEFKEAIRTTTVDLKKYINLECTLCLDPEIPIYTKGQIQYGLNFLEVSKEANESEGLTCFSEFPLSCLYEGVFLSQSHAESYLTLKTANHHPHPKPLQQEEKDNKKDKENKDKKVKKEAEQPTTIETGAEEPEKVDFGVSTRHMNDRMEHTSLQKMLIDGFKKADDTGGPYAAETVSPFKAYLQQKIRGCNIHTQMFDACYCILILMLLERKTFNRRLGLDIYRILHGTAGRLHYTMDQIGCLSYIIQALSNTVEIDVIKQHMNMLRENITHLFQDDLTIRSAEQITLAKALKGSLENLMRTDNVNLPFASEKHVNKCVQVLQFQHLYCSAMMIPLMEDSVEWISKLVEYIQSLTPDAAATLVTRYRARLDVLGEEVVLDIDHGMEDETTKNNDRYFIDVESCMKRDTTVPKSIAKEAVLLKYMVDTHLDRIWHDFLLDLATDIYFPPNPYPIIVTTFREGNCRMDLCRQKGSVVADNVYSPENMKLEDPLSFVYHIPGVDCHGVFTAMAVMDTGAYVPLSEIITKLEQTTYTKKKGPYRVAVCMAISGPSILYGKMQPYLNEVELHEHIYIRGPPGCQGDAIHLFSVMVYEHVMDLIHHGNNPVMGIYFGETEYRWSWQALENKKKDFVTECSLVCRNKEQIFMKTFIFMEWRYVPVKKHFLLHYLTDEDTKPMTFFQEDPVDFYKCVFLTKEKAVFHYQNGGPSGGGDPMSFPNIMKIQKELDRVLLESEKKSDWLKVHRDIILKSVLFQNKRFLTDPWRMLHSIAGSLEYTKYMTNTLKDLVLLFIEHFELLERKAEENKEKNPKKKKIVKANKMVGPLDEAIFGRMFMIYYEKLLTTVEDKNALMPLITGKLLERKLSLVIEEDHQLDNFYLGYDQLSISILEEIRCLLQMMQDSTAADVHSISLDSCAVLKNIHSVENKVAESTSAPSRDFLRKDIVVKKPQMLTF